MLKRIIAIFSISLVITGSFFSVYNSEYPVYADSASDEWLNVTTNEQLAEAFRYYCKSRDLTIEGSLADGVTSFTTKTFNGLCNSLGIDMTALQSQVKYQTDGNLGIKFLFSSTGVNAFNRIFAQFLQDNELEVGDTVDDQNVYDGYYYNNQLIWVFSGIGNFNSDPVLQRGNWAISKAEGIAMTESSSEVAYQFALGSNTYTSYVRRYSTSSLSGTYEQTLQISKPSTSTRIYFATLTTNYISEGGVCYGYGLGSRYIGLYVYKHQPTDPNYQYIVQEVKTIDISNTDAQPCNIYITTNNQTINNNNYEGDTIINNEGDVINNNYPDPNPNPTPDPPTIPDSGGWQDFSLPDMPNDWLIYGMEKKFPFDIPFNILFALSLLNHEPEIPKFEGDIDLQVCTWHYDIDLTPFDDIATILRKFEVLGFIIGLAILTKNLINWG